MKAVKNPPNAPKPVDLMKGQLVAMQSSQRVLGNLRRALNNGFFPGNQSGEVHEGKNYIKYLLEQTNKQITTFTANIAELEKAEAKEAKKAAVKAAQDENRDVEEEISDSKSESINKNEAVNEK